jgi:hypothetical protein
VQHRQRFDLAQDKRLSRLSRPCAERVFQLGQNGVAIRKTRSKSADHFRPFQVEELAFGFVGAFVGVGTEALRGGATR